jgi:hypothetical protein
MGAPKTAIVPIEMLSRVHMDHMLSLREATLTQRLIVFSHLSNMGDFPPRQLAGLLAFPSYNPHKVIASSEELSAPPHPVRYASLGPSFLLMRRAGAFVPSRLFPLAIRSGLPGSGLGSRQRHQAGGGRSHPHRSRRRG